MMLLRYIAFGATLSLCVSVAGQSRAFPGKASSDPFVIEQGSTFSASSPRRPAAPSSATAASSILTDVQDAIEIIRSNHANGRKLIDADLAKSSIVSMLRSLDPHSNYYDKLEYEELLGDQRSEYFGTGSTIVSYERDKRLQTYIISTFPGSASERAGLRFGDRITAVDGKDVTLLSSLEIRDMIRGPRGTTVKVTVDRNGSQLTFSLRRDRVAQPTVTNAFLMESGAGLIEMSDGFSFTSYAEFDAAFRELKRNGMTSLVLDLRGNPGGILEQSIKIAEKFLQEGSLIVSQKGRMSNDDRIWRSANRRPETLPIVVLVDGDTASASEVIAGALQDNDRAVIVGQRTFGKGLVQSVVDLPQGGGLTLTTAKYYTPSGRSIQRDYEHQGAYDYYNHKNDEASSSPNRSKAYISTRERRKVFGGDGILPDVQVKPDEVTKERIALLDPIFFYSQRLIAREPSAISDRDVSDFIDFARNDWAISEPDINAEREFIRLRLGYNLTLARSGSTAASEFLLKRDHVVAKAITAMPQAISFASSYYSLKAAPQK